MAKSLFKRLRKPQPRREFRRGKKAQTDFGPLVVEAKKLEDDRLNDLARQLGSLDKAKKVLRLQQAYPNGTLPELVVMEYLNRTGVEYIFQLQAFGGRGEAAGVGFVPDFLCWFDRSQGTVINVQGFYFHSAPEKRERDAGYKLRLMGQYFSGVRVVQVVDCWDLDLMTPNADGVIRNALAGIEIKR